MNKDSSIKLVNESQFDLLIESGAIRRVFIVENSSGGFHIVGRGAETDYHIRLKRGGERIFKDLGRCANHVRGMGISKIHLHLNEFKPSVDSLC